VTAEAPQEVVDMGVAETELMCNHVNPDGALLPDIFENLPLSYPLPFHKISMY
jgi:hypothetical protein